MIVDLFFPRTCLRCSRLGVFICERCRKQFSYIRHDICLYCSKASPYGYTHPGCRHPDGVDGVMSIFIYASAIKDVIKGIKYHSVPDAFHELFMCVYDSSVCRFMRFARMHPEAVLQPMPLHLTRLKERGFNQSSYIASFFSAMVLYEVINGLRRDRRTASQAQIHTPGQRAVNMKNAFCAIPEFSMWGKTIILVDDVVTSGSTITEAAGTIKRAGAKAVFAWTLARGYP